MKTAWSPTYSVLIWIGITQPLKNISPLHAVFILSSEQKWENQREKMYLKSFRLIFVLTFLSFAFWIGLNFIEFRWFSRVSKKGAHAFQIFHFIKHAFHEFIFHTLYDDAASLHNMRLKIITIAYKLAETSNSIDFSIWNIPFTFANIVIPHLNQHRINEKSLTHWNSSMTLIKQTN